MNRCYTLSCNNQADQKRWQTKIYDRKWQEDSEYMSYVADLLETEAVKISQLCAAYELHTFGTFDQRLLL